MMCNSAAADREGERQGHFSLNFHLQLLRLMQAMAIDSEPFCGVRACVLCGVRVCSVLCARVCSVCVLCV